MASREFVDSEGMAWMVWSVVPGEMSGALTRLTGAAEDRRVPWLVFQNADGAKRRLVPVPQGWEDCNEATLADWNSRGVAVPPAPARRVVD